MEDGPVVVALLTQADKILAGFRNLKTGRKFIVSQRKNLLQLTETFWLMTKIIKTLQETLLSYIYAQTSLYNHRQTDSVTVTKDT